MSLVSTFSVRWVYSKPIGGREGGQRPSLCFRGRKHALCVVSGHPVRVLKRPVDLFDKYREAIVPLPGAVETGKGTVGAARYPVTQAAEKLREIGSRNGITAAAAKLIDRALTNSADVDEDSFNDEEEVTMEQTQENVAAASAKAAEKKAAKASAKASKAKAKPAKAVKAKGGKAKGNGSKKPAGDGLGRPGSLSRFINERLVKGQSNDVISAAAKKAFPKSKSTKPSHVSWFRWKLSDSGLLKSKK